MKNRTLNTYICAYITCIYYILSSLISEFKYNVKDLLNNYDHLFMNYHEFSQSKCGRTLKDKKKCSGYAERNHTDIYN